MFPGVTVDVVKHFPPELEASHMQFAQQFAVGNSVYGEDVYPYSSEVAEVHALYHGCAFVFYLAVVVGKGYVRFAFHHFERCGKPFSRVLYKAVVVGPRHVDVNVVVPWNESLVPYGAEHGAARHIVAQTVCAAHGVESIHNFKAFHLERPDIEINLASHFRAKL